MEALSLPSVSTLMVRTFIFGWEALQACFISSRKSTPSLSATGASEVEGRRLEEGGNGGVPGGRVLDVQEDKFVLLDHGMGEGVLQAPTDSQVGGKGKTKTCFCLKERYILSLDA